MFSPNKHYRVRWWDAGSESRSNETLISVSGVQAPPPPWLWSLGMLQWPLRTNKRRARDISSQWKTEMSLTGNMANCYKGESHASLCLPNHVILNFQTLTLTSNAWMCSVRLSLRKKGHYRQGLFELTCVLPSLLTVMLPPPGGHYYHSGHRSQPASDWPTQLNLRSDWLTVARYWCHLQGSNYPRVPWDQRTGQKLFVA